MTALHKAAAALAAIHRGDRRWILSRLPASQRRKLAAELQAFDHSSLTSALSTNAESPVEDGIETAALMMATPASLLPLLRQLPAGCVALVLKHRAWPWRDGVLSLMTEAERRAQAFGESAAAARMSPAALGLVIRALTRRIEAGSASSARANPFEKLLGAPEEAR